MPNLSKGALAGAVSGVVAALAMSFFATARSRLTGKRRGLGRIELSNLEASRYVNGSNLEMDSIALAADQLDRWTGHRMSPTQKSAFSAGIHFAIGATLGAAYGMAAESIGIVRRGGGVPFAVVEAASGNLVWTVATRSFRHYSARDQAESIIDHAVFGAVLESTRNLVRRAI